MTIVIKDISIEIQNDLKRVSGMVGDKEIWYEFDPSFEPTRLGDVFVCASLAFAMAKGEDLELDTHYSISSELKDSLEHYQDIFCFWYPDKFKKIQICATRAIESHQDNGNVGSFFSGGADSFYTLMRQKDVIDDLIFIHGLDMQLDNDNQFQQVWAANSKIAKEYGKRLLLVKTNMRYLPTSLGLSWPLHCQGLGLASVAHLLGHSTVFVPASYTYGELFPCASHPLTDPMLSSESVRLIHDGADRRSSKIRRIAQDPQALNMLRVCWMDDGYNCGKCEKCVRTMLVLRLLGVSSDAFPYLANLDTLRKFRLHDKSEFTFIEDSIALADEVGAESDLKYLRKIKKSISIKRALIDVEKAFFNGALKKLVKRS